jgi:hypothetical protein
MASLNEDCRTAKNQMTRRSVAYQGATGAVEAVGYNFKTSSLFLETQSLSKGITNV